MNNLLRNIPAIGIAATLCLALNGCEGPPSLEASVASTTSVPEFSHEVKTILDQRVELVCKLLENEIILAAVKDSNARQADMPLDKILELDAKWRQSSETSPFILSHMVNPCAKQLMQFQGTDLGVSEFFVTDSRGLNVCQTNKTTDYYQADEQWWVDSFNDGAGRPYYGHIEYDESAQSEAISLYAPVMDLQTNRAIGVAKVVIDITSIMQEL